MGKLVLIDPARGRQENAGVQLVAPPRDTPAVRIDAYGQDGELFQYPTRSRKPITWSPTRPWAGPTSSASERHGGQGARPAVRRVLDDDRRAPRAAGLRSTGVLQSAGAAGAPRAAHASLGVDYTKSTGAYYLQDIYAGPGLEGIARGTVKKLRVVALDFRAALIGAMGTRAWPARRSSARRRR